MTEFWFTLAGGALLASPIAWAAGRYSAIGLLDRLAAWIAYDEAEHLDDTVRRHPANPTDRCFRHVTVLRPEHH